MAEIERLSERRSSSGYSAEDDSDWQKLSKQIQLLWRKAYDDAGKDQAMLERIANDAEDGEAAVLAIQRLIELKPTPDRYLQLAKRLQASVVFGEVDQRGKILPKAENAARLALRGMATPTADATYTLADILEDREQYSEAVVNFRKAVDLSRKSSDRNTESFSLRALIRIAAGQKKYAETEAWFAALVQTGLASAFDWSAQADRLFNTKKYVEAGAAYRTSAEQNKAWKNWCMAALSFSGIPTNDDDTLFCSRRCIETAVGTGILMFIVDTPCL
jgi:tetratricopeptide (TPR) repeat protein